MIRGPHTFSTGKERSNGYLKAIKDFGLPYDDQLIVQGKYSEKQSYDSAMKLFNSDNPPTAVFSSNDLMALRVYDAALSCGLSVPRDVALVGFDDIEIASHRAIGLTTVSQNLNMMAEIAFDTLRKMIENGPFQQPVQVVLKPMLTVRKTCGSQIKKI